MKKNIITIVILLLVLISCKPNDEKEENQNKLAKDSTIIGADQDENGCLASAGYTWSKLNKECVRAFTGIQLNPTNNSTTEDVTLCSYVLFNDDGDKAEVFMPDENSIILTRVAKGRPWINKEYQLESNNGYVLKKLGTIIYSGDAEIGNKVTGSDNPEEGE